MSRGWRTLSLSSLRWRLTISISGVVLLCVAVCVAAAVLFLRQALTDRATREMRNTLTGVSGYLDNQSSDLRGAAKVIAADPVVASRARTDDRFGLIVHLSPFFAELNVDVMDVIDAGGRVVVRMEDTRNALDVVRNRTSVQQVLAGGEVVGFEQDLPRLQAAGGYSLRASVPLRQGNRVVGVVVVGRQLDSIFAARIGHAINAQVNLIAGNLRTGTTLTDAHGLPLAGVREPAGILARIASGRTSMETTQEDGESVLSGIVPLHDPGNRLIGAVEIVRPLGPLYDVIRLLSLVLLALGAVVVTVGILLALDISRRLTSRLQVLESTASRVAAMAGEDVPLGELDVARAVPGNDEVASLARSFGAMMTALDSRMAANAALYEAAQARVRELMGLAEIARLLTATTPIRQTIDLLGQHVCRLVGCSAVAIWLPGEELLPSLYGGHGLPDGFEALTNETMIGLAGTDFEIVAQHALRTGEVTHASLEREAPRHVAAHLDLRAALSSRGLKSATAVPLRIQERIVGALTCYSHSPEPLPASDLSLLTTIADQVAVAVENARLSLRSRDIAALEERQRIARELHDSVSQALYGIALGARTARTMLERDPSKVSEPLEYVLTQADAGLTEMRALIFALRPESLQTEGLVVALNKQVDSLRARHGMFVEASLGAEPEAPAGVKEAIYRIALEAMHNTLRHSCATRIVLQLHSTAGRLVLDVQDDGVGFDPGREFPGHLGLQTMQERTAQLGGSFCLRSAPGEGTHVHAEVPSRMVEGTTLGVA